MILEANQISYAYPGGTTALDRASLSIRAGERLAILGHNGAGKSTLLLALNGSVRPETGEIRRLGQVVDYSRKGLLAWRNAVGLVLQDPDDQLFAATVFEDVSFGPLNLGLDAAEARSRVDRALAAMGIASLADRPTHMLSFGQRKRVAIAGVLAMQPSVLLLDEPTAGLDPAGVEELMATLTALSAAGTTVVVATHDMDVAHAWADRVAIFSQHRVIAEGTPDVVFGDRAMLTGAGLREPLVHAIARALQARGMIADQTPIPRSQSDLIRMIENS